MAITSTVAAVKAKNGQVRRMLGHNWAKEIAAGCVSVMADARTEFEHGSHVQAASKAPRTHTDIVSRQGNRKGSHTGTPQHL